MRLLLAAAVLFQHSAPSGLQAEKDKTPSTIKAALSKVEGYSKIKDQTPLDGPEEAYAGFIGFFSKVNPAVLAKEARPVDYAAYAKTSAELRGQPVRIKALFLQSNPIRLEKESSVNQWIHRTYLCDVSGNEGYVVDLLEPPPELANRQEVSVEAAFFKRGTYQGKKGPITAPYFIGHSLKAEK